MRLEIKCSGATTANVKELLDFQGDLKTLSDDNYIKFRAELLELGYSEPISVWIDPSGKKYVLNGHQRRKTILNMISEGIEVDDLPINLVDADDLKQAKRKVLALTSQYGEMSQDGLKDFCEKNSFEFDEMIKDFRFPELEAMELDLLEEQEETDGDDDASEEVENVTKLGDLWEIGNHRLLCGDSTNKATVEKLMDGHKADMVFTDPPYNISYGKLNHSKFKKRDIENDNMSDEDFKKFVEGFVSTIISFCDGIVYCWADQGSNGRNMFSVLDENLHSSTVIIWCKDKFTLGRGKYQSQYEPCWFGWVKSGKSFTEDRTLTNIWNFPRPKKSELHPTMKPIEVVENGINHSSRKGDSVLDLFLGSGSTLIACEKTNRKCYGMELEEHYCDVIVNRYIDWCLKNGKEYFVKLNGIEWSR